MPPQLALLIGAIFVFFAFRSDRKRADSVSTDLRWPTLWYLIAASRPFGTWLVLWNIPLPGGSGDATEGSPVDRNFLVFLTLMGFWILARRGFNWGATFRNNPWLTALLAYMALSIFWSEYSYVSFKRYIKVVGSITMALVVLSEARPRDAIFTVLRRCLYIHLPMSIIVTRYYREIGVSYDWSGSEQSWQGISTSKNTLGQVAMLGVVYFYWEVRRRWPEEKWRSVNFLYLIMALYLLKGAEGSISVTSVSVCAIALVVFTRIQALRSRPASVRPFVLTVFSGTVALIVLVLLHSMVTFSSSSLFGTFIEKFGRDITLTGRTDIWSDAYAASHNPLLGVGFGGFWIGRLANIPWNANMTWILGQAHSGYVDTYLQLGLVGWFLLAAVIFTTLPRLIDSLKEDFDLGSFRITLFVIILFVNITETTLLRGEHQFWFIFQIVFWLVPAPAPPGPAGSLRGNFPA